MRTKKVKPPPKQFDYLMNISKEYDEIVKKDYISFKIQTTKEFLTFRYKLTIETEIKENKLCFNIIGFSAPKGDLSNSGVAEFEYKFYDFKYTEYQMIIERKNIDKCRYKFKIMKSKTSPVKLISSARNSYIQVTA